MRYRILGRTGLRVSVVSFGAGPVPALMTGDDGPRQRAVLRRALDVGINWFDTAAGYGLGKSESNLGAALASLGALDAVHVATKVRLLESDLADIPAAVEASVKASLGRLGLARVTLLQFHNSITARRGDEPTSLTPDDVLGPRGVLEALEQQRAAGRAAWIGLTGIGQAAALRAVISSGRFDTLQTPYNLLNPSAGQEVPADFAEVNYGGIMNDCARQGMGVFAIRVLAGGALAGLPPSDYTHQTKFFPLALYQRDQQRTTQLASAADGNSERVKQRAFEFALAHPAVTSAIIGLSQVEQVDEAAHWAEGIVERTV